MNFSSTTDLAEWLRENAFSTHRGVARISSGQFLAFGYDGGVAAGEVDLFCAAACGSSPRFGVL